MASMHLVEIERVAFLSRFLGPLTASACVQIVSSAASWPPCASRPPGQWQHRYGVGTPSPCLLTASLIAKAVREQLRFGDASRICSSADGRGGLRVLEA